MWCCGGLRHADELSEALTLVQTGKTRKMPIILVHSPFWQGLLDWFRDQMQKELIDRAARPRPGADDRRSGGGRGSDI